MRTDRAFALFRVAMMCVLLLCWVLADKSYAGETHKLDDLLRLSEPMRDMRFQMKVRFDTVGIREETFQISVLDATHYRMRSSSFNAIEVYEGGNRTYSEWPESERLSVADGKDLWQEQTRYDRVTKKPTYSLTQEPVSEGTGFRSPGTLSSDDMRRMVQAFDIRFLRVDVFEGRKVAVFGGPVAGDRVPGMARMYVQDIELTLDVETGLVYSSIIRGGGSGEYRPTQLIQLSRVQRKAGLKADQFAFQEERATEKAMLERVSASAKADEAALNSAAAQLASAPESDLRDSKMQRAAALLLAERGDPHACAALSYLIKKTHGSARGGLIGALAKTKDPKAIDVLLTLAGDPEYSTAALAVKALGEMNDRRSVDVLIPLVANRQSPLRLEALRALAKLRDPASIDCLGGVALESSSPGPEIACLTLLEMKDAKATEKVIAALQADSVYSKTAAAKAFAQTKDPAGVGALIECLPCKYAGVRMEVMRALAEIGDKRAVDPIVGRLQDPSRDGRLAAIECLGRLRDPRAVSPLKDRLARERDETLAHATRQALIRLGATPEPATTPSPAKDGGTVAASPQPVAAAPRPTASTAPVGGSSVTVVVQGTPPASNPPAPVSPATASPTVVARQSSAGAKPAPSQTPQPQLPLPPRPVLSDASHGLAAPVIGRLLAPWRADFSCLRWSYNTAWYTGRIHYEDEEHYRIEYEAQAVETWRTMRVEELHQKPVIKHVIVRSGEICWHQLTSATGGPVAERLNCDWRDRTYQQGHLLFDPRAPLGPQMQTLAPCFRAWQSSPAPDRQAALKAQQNSVVLGRSAAAPGSPQQNLSIRDMAGGLELRLDDVSGFPVEIITWCPDRESRSFSMTLTNITTGAQVGKITPPPPDAATAPVRDGEPRPW